MKTLKSPNTDNAASAYCHEQYGFESQANRSPAEPMNLVPNYWALTVCEAQAGYPLSM